MSHYKEVCEHGTVGGQCRCPGPKSVRIIPCPPKCKHKAKEEDIPEDIAPFLQLLVFDNPKPELYNWEDEEDDQES